MIKRYRLLVLLVACFVMGTTAMAQTFRGDSACATCHNTVNSNLGYNIWQEYTKTGHPYKLNPVNGAAPTYPANTSPVTIPLPPNTTWNDFAYVIGGYGWKARWVRTNGRIFTVGDSGQYNIHADTWVAYHKGEEKKYDYSCFICHTTGPDPSGSWNGVAADSLGTFAQPGIRCEACHGPAGDHITNPTGVKPFRTGDTLRVTRCGECHNRGSQTNAIPVSGGYIRHHEQLNEFRASKHGDGNGTDLTCASCHTPHVAAHYPDAAGAGLNGIKTKCQTCHPTKQVLVNGTPKSIDCVDCHMSKATKSAVGTQMGNGWKGDVKTHIFGINTNPYVKDSMFTADGKVKLDANGLAAVTLDFACLSCHTTKDVTWAASYADSIHTKGITTSVETLEEIPSDYALEQNFPNPFNPSSTIRFSLPEASYVMLKVYDINGQEVASLIDNRMPSGSHQVKFDATDWPSGMYVYTIQAGSFRSSRKMLLLK